jgi:hypothetical protein
MREQMERSREVRDFWNRLAQKDARTAAIVIGMFVLFLLVPFCLERFHIPMPSWTYMPD